MNPYVIARVALLAMSATFTVLGFALAYKYVVGF